MNGKRNFCPHYHNIFLPLSIVKAQTKAKINEKNRTKNMIYFFSFRGLYFSSWYFVDISQLYHHPSILIHFHTASTTTKFYAVESTVELSILSNSFSNFTINIRHALKEYAYFNERIHISNSIA